MPQKSEYLNVRIESDLMEWLGNDNRSKKVRRILKWCMESYPNIDDLLELIKK